MATYAIRNTLDINDLNDFKSAIGQGKGDLAKVARFAVQIDGVNAITTSRDLTFLCEAAEFPGRALNVDDIRYYGPSFKMPYQSAYTDLNLTFLCRDMMLEKEFFDAWIEYINPKDRYDFEYRDFFGVPIHIWQFSSIGTIEGKLMATYKVTLNKAYPIFINPMTTNWAEDNFHRLQVTFAYVDWFTPSPREIRSEAFSLVEGAEIASGSRLEIYRPR